MATAEDRLLEAVYRWSHARQERLAVKRQMERFWCQFAEEEDETGGGIDRCYRSPRGTDEWCDACRARNPVFEHMKNLKRIEKGYLNGLCSLLDRRAKARSAGAVDPVEGIDTDCPRATETSSSAVSVPSFPPADQEE